VAIKSPVLQATPEASRITTMLVDAKEAARQLSLSVRKVRKRLVWLSITHNSVGYGGSVVYQDRFGLKSGTYR